MGWAGWGKMRGMEQNPIIKENIQLVGLEGVKGLSQRRA